VLGSKPSRTLLHEWNDASHNTDWDKLETDWDSPLNITSGRINEGDSVCDPVRGYLSVLDESRLPLWTTYQLHR
jgi:hypothetical protein